MKITADSGLLGIKMKAPKMIKPYIKLIGGAKQTITFEQAIKIKKILDGELEPENKAQETYILSVEEIYIPNVDTNSTEAIRAFIRAHIAIDPHKLKDDIYKARWINDYNNKRDSSI